MPVHALAPLAVGGREHVRVLPAGASIGDAATDIAFDADSTGPSTFRVIDVSAPDLTIEAVRAGTAHLRIESPGTSLLIDTIAIRVEDVVETRLVTLASSIAAPGRAIEEIAAGATVPPFQAELYGTSGALLWDDSLVLTAPDAVPSSGSLEVVVTRDAAQVRSLLPVVTTATDLRIGSSSFSLVDGLDPDGEPNDPWVLDPARRPSLLCALPVDGERVVAGSAIAVTSGDDAVLRIEPDIGIDGCVGVSFVAGETDVRVSALGVTRWLHVIVRDP